MGCRYTKLTPEGPCMRCASLCPTGTYTEHGCETPRQRAAPVKCLSCQDHEHSALPENARYTSGCQWACSTGFYWDSGALVCTACALCALGQFPTGNPVCTVQKPTIECVQCANIPPNGLGLSRVEESCPFECEVGYTRKFVNNGADIICAARFTTNDVGAVQAPPPPPPPASRPTVVEVQGRPRRVDSIASTAACRQSDLASSTVLLLFSWFLRGWVCRL